MPLPDLHNPLTPALLLRTLRLNCLTRSYAKLWEDLFGRFSLAGEQWAVSWDGLAPLAGSIAAEWDEATPLRNERERRAALVELDALVAVWLGIGVEELIAIYRGRYPILADREAELWFDADGHRIAADPYAFGFRQRKEHYRQLMDHLDPEIEGPVPEGYRSPFYKADREAEYRRAHAVFTERLRQAGWPTTNDAWVGKEGGA